ncbi:hypothetical protein PT974_04175 [Cladobotryum mycophilum]|uniref:N-acetyltransferase domain-containing protein n=1 Tax=Cladobotryum mycophilum TaxID=491253 RepID=A0ABR0SUB0_9HYPO
MAASALTTNPAAVPQAPSSPALTINFPAATTADDALLVSAIVRLVNLVFVEAEAGIWRDGFNRTTETEVVELIRQGQLALGYLNIEPSSAPIDGYLTPHGLLVGGICIKRTSPTLGSFNMLALDKRYQGTGLGRELVLFAERHCRELGCSTMALDLLVPTTYAHPLKTRMQAWYLRLGYEIMKLGSFAEDYPELAPLLAGPVEFRFFEKKLV